jgi:hypothetical protein
LTIGCFYKGHLTSTSVALSRLEEFKKDLRIISSGRKGKATKKHQSLCGS